MLTTENLTQMALQLGVSAIVIAGIPFPAIAWEGTKLGYVLGLLKYSRGKEAEADRLGLEVMNAAGYDPNEMAAVFRLSGVELEIDVLIDDSPVNLLKAAEAGITPATIVHPWNRDLCEEEAEVVSADDWPALADALEVRLPRLRRAA